jgi:TonB family protein
MSLMVETTIKVSSIVLFALVASAALRSRSAALRHWVLAAAIVCAAAAPGLQRLVPAWNVELITPAVFEGPTPFDPSRGAGPSRASMRATGGQASGAAGLRSIDAGQWLTAIWLAGVLISLFGLLAGFARLAWLAAHSGRVVHGRWLRLLNETARRNGIKRPVRLLQSSHPSLLVTWGCRRPKIILPSAARDWSADRIRVVLLHELAHIRRGDWLTQLAAEGLRAIYWFNPIVWIASRRLRQESEQACDDAVLNGGVEGSDYATHLLALARAARLGRRTLLAGFPAPAMARPSSIERRFSAMLNGRINRMPITRPARVASTLAVAAVTVLIAGLGIAQTFSTFSGSVFDPTNNVLPEVTLVLTNAQSQAKYEVRTDRNGRFEFVGLPPGEYSWETRLAGFAALRGSVQVAGRDIQQDLTLQVGSLQETISVKSVKGGGTQGSTQAGRRNSAGDVNEIRRKMNESTCAPGAQLASGVGGNIRAPRKLTDVRPRYPDHLSAAGVGGVVVLDAIIDTNGDVSDVSVVRSPNPELEAAAIEAVRQWQFTSTVLNCLPIEVKMNVTVNFLTE